ncbi:SMP-30/gluconolactonase/LRE family protein [Hoeflea sp. TYP-13]|uniref:SMP-30/gluconolactonase/LRE family protein n=1 Tax=Hoeflea sp. TYP-13 TaxID=3230023 RepID=UPI0034C5C244
MGELKCLWEAGAELGEGVRYDPDEDAVWWVDILGQKIFRLDLQTGDRRTWETPETVGCTIQRENGDVLALLRHTIARLDMQSGSFDTVVAFPQEPAANRFNDGAVSPDGRLWVCSMDFDFQEPTGMLYHLGRDLQPVVADEGYTVANGPAFSPDGSKLYVNETMKGEIFVCDCDPSTGALSGKKLFAKLEEGEGLPDGICVDADGGLWVAVVTGGRVRRYLPNGNIDMEIEVPSPTVTSVGFGGRANRTLFITTGTILMDEETLARHPLSGSLFAIEVPHEGLEMPAFSG